MSGYYDRIQGTDRLLRIRRLRQALFAGIVGLLMRNLEIRHAQRDGQRYLMAKSSMARAIRTAGFAIGLAVILLLAVTPTLAASLYSDAQQVVPLSPRAREVV